jgi:hypothetical protein
VRRLILGTAIVLAATACAGVRAAPPLPGVGALQIEPTGTPYVRVTTGLVSALVPSRWSARALANHARQGFLASPNLTTWDGLGLPRRGMTATWIDATSVGVASDYYYMAASGPLIARLVSDPGCRTVRETVFADHVPAFMDGEFASPGDFVARGSGVCGTAAARSRWSYFVAAPGYGPATELGIPGSGLYLVAAVTTASPGATARLQHLLGNVRFGDARIGDFVRAVREPAALA